MKCSKINLNNKKAPNGSSVPENYYQYSEYRIYSEILIHRGQIGGLTTSGGTAFSVAPNGNSRSCLYFRNHTNAVLDI
jgi:hypothetical protein